MRKANKYWSQKLLPRHVTHTRTSHTQPHTHTYTQYIFSQCNQRRKAVYCTFFSLLVNPSHHYMDSCVKLRANMRTCRTLTFTAIPSSSALSHSFDNRCSTTTIHTFIANGRLHLDSEQIYAPKWWRCFHQNNSCYSSGNGWEKENLWLIAPLCLCTFLSVVPNDN